MRHPRLYRKADLARRSGGAPTTGTVAVMVLCFTASLVLAEDVLYCVDTNVVGFKWDNIAEALPTDFAALRHTVKVVSDTERIITRMIGDTAGDVIGFTCYHPFSRRKDTIACEDSAGNTWIFYRDSIYTRAFLTDPPRHNDANILIAHGTCTTF
jgi:hypothetical protein